MTINCVQNGFSFGFDYFFIDNLLFGQGIESMSDVFWIGLWVEGSLNDFLGFLRSTFQLLAHGTRLHGLEGTLNALAKAAFVD